MPVSVTYPGVYIQEIPSGIRTITGVATSITAFIGRTAFGPTDWPETIFSYGDFQRRYGGLQYDYPLSYAVQDFFMNGGSQAVICRLFEPNQGDKTNGVASIAVGPPPVPKGWKLKNKVPAGAAQGIITGGDLAPEPRQSLTLNGESVEVMLFNPANNSILFKAPLQSDAAAGSDLQFSTGASTAKPNATGWTVGVDAPLGSLQATITGGTNDPQVGQAFTIGADKLTVSSYNSGTKMLTFSPKLTADAPPGTAITFSPPATATPLTLSAASPGSWGKRIQVAIDRQGLDITPLAQRAVQPYVQYGQSADDLFNITISCQQPDGTSIVERFTNVTIKSAGANDKAPNRLDRVLSSQSNLVRMNSLPQVSPSDGDVGSASGGNDGGTLQIMTYLGNQDKRTGMFMLENTDLFNLMVIPPDSRGASSDIDPFVLQSAAVYCTQRRAMLLVDSPSDWTNAAKRGTLDQLDPSALGITGEVNGTETARNAAVYYPRLIKEDPVMNGQLDVFAPSGTIAGIMAATDASRGVWKAPAGLDAGIAGIQALEVKLTDEQNGLLNPLGINCLRTFPVIGPVVWGARTLRGADILEDDYKYVPVRRLTLFIEESLYRGTKWAVFEPNDERLWSSLRLSINSFLADLSRQGAFYAFNVTCDATTTTQRDIDLGIVNVLVQIAPVKPAEFVVISIQQIAGQKQS